MATETTRKKKPHWKTDEKWSANQIQISDERVLFLFLSSSFFQIPTSFNSSILVHFPPLDPIYRLDSLFIFAYFRVIIIWFTKGKHIYSLASFQTSSFQCCPPTLMVETQGLYPIFSRLGTIPLLPKVSQLLFAVLLGGMTNFFTAWPI